MSNCQVAIIGAGPYGLSVAAYLRGRGIDFRIFGSPMNTWIKEMPKGMKLKSEGFASSLYDPQSQFTLADYSREKGLPYADTGLPVPLETFWSYGLEFQKRYVPNLEQKTVVSLKQSAQGFEIGLADGEVFTAGKVVMAIGLTYFGYLPPEFSGFPRELVSHSSVYGDLAQFKGKSVAVIGAGASALDIAALLHQAGAKAQVVARSKVIRFHDKPVLPRPLWQRIRRPATGIGNGWKLVFYAGAPGVFQRMPESYRLEVVRNTLGPAPGWFVRDEVVGNVPLHLGAKSIQVAQKNSGIQLDVEGGDASRQSLQVDHVIAATGYRVDVRRLGFLDNQLRDAVRCVDHTPILSGSFESSVPGMYFVGTSSANSFGPLMRFAVGAKFTVDRITRYLAEPARRSSVAVGPAKGVAAGVTS